jgi:cellobiose dehydrogenase (acceptor)
MQFATQRVFSRIPGTDHPSMDGKLYIQSGFDIVRQGLAAANWTSVTANDVPGKKDKTYAHTEYMYINGERGGPMATYLVSANGRNNFHLWLNTSVERINRIGGHATSLDVIATNDGGHVGTVKLTNTTGRVILAAGTFGTPKILFRSGIGPDDMLQQVQQSPDGPTFIKSTDWINLPVGYNLADHLNTDCVISHPNISYYDWPAAWNTPIEADKVSYLKNRTGPFAQAAPNIGPMMWEVIKGPDGIDRQMQWTSRVEGSNGVPNGNSMTLSLYLGRGSVSRGRTTIGKSLNMVVNTLPYGDPNDLTAVGWAIDNMVNALKTIPNITWNLPPPGVSGADYLKSVNELSLSLSLRCLPFPPSPILRQELTRIDPINLRQRRRPARKPLDGHLQTRHRRRASTRRDRSSRHQHQDLRHGQHVRRRRLHLARDAIHEPLRSHRHRFRARFRTNPRTAMSKEDWRCREEKRSVL